MILNIKLSLLHSHIDDLVYYPIRQIRFTIYNNIIDKKIMYEFFGLEDFSISVFR